MSYWRTNSDDYRSPPKGATSDYDSQSSRASYYNDEFSPKSTIATTRYEEPPRVYGRDSDPYNTSPRAPSEPYDRTSRGYTASGNDSSFNRSGYGSSYGRLNYDNGAGLTESTKDPGYGGYSTSAVSPRPQGYEGYGRSSYSSTYGRDEPVQNGVDVNRDKSTNSYGGRYREESTLDTQDRGHQVEYGSIVEDLLMEHVPAGCDVLEINGGTEILGPKMRELGYNDIELVDNSMSNVKRSSGETEAYKKIYQGQQGAPGGRAQLETGREYGCLVVTGTNDLIIDTIDELVEEKLAPGGYGVLVGSSTRERSRATDVLNHITRKRIGNIRVLSWKKTRLPEKDGQSLEVTKIVLKKRHD